MIVRKIEASVLELNDQELPQQLRNLVSNAKRMTYKAYAPYSHFSVGAAILLSDGSIATGNNQENIAYPSGLCAERTACYWAHANYPELKMLAIAIAARGVDGEFQEQPITPCGACRQALIEYERAQGAPIQVILVGRNKVLMVESISALLPLAFDF